MLALLSSKVFAFALLGPLDDWMEPTKTLGMPGDIGGPMNINEGYRWNIPVVTYGFDRAFLDYFGSNGVAAVESAFQILNAIPPASQITLTNYLLNPWAVNYQAQAIGLTDLKTTILSALLEQMGLADPTRYVFCVRDYQYYSSNNILFTVIQRNFDPATAQPSSFVNDTLFTYQLIQFFQSPTQGTPFCDAQEILIDPFSNWRTSVAGSSFGGFGEFVTGLSRDDVGGIRHLLSGARVRFETLPTDVEAVDTNTPLVVSAYRPGIEKVTFVRHPYSVFSGEFLPTTNHWTDIYYSGNSVGYQSVRRRLMHPDIIIAGRDLVTRMLDRTGSTNWINHAVQNGNPGGAGPGVIQPHITIALNNAAPMWINQIGFFLPVIPLSEATQSVLLRWGSFNGSTNLAVSYPSGLATFQPTTVTFRLSVSGHTNLFQWVLPGAPQSRYAFQSSTNLGLWLNLTTLTNTGMPFEYFHQGQTNETARFFRLKAD